MKIYKLTLIILTILILSQNNPLSGITNKEKITQQERITIPCSGVQYSSDRDYFRATGTATNRNLRTAERIARLDANANLAASISVTVQSVTERYISEVQVGDQFDIQQRFEDITRSVAEQELSNISVVCSETEFKNGNYTIYIAIETPRNHILNNIENDISQDQSTNLLYEKKKFEQIFNEEMEKLEKEKN